jgi:pilus assembly protein CpaB
MNVKTWIPLALAIVLGVVAAKVARDVLMKNKPQPTQTVKLTKVVIAKADLIPGRQLQAEDLTVGEVTPTSVPEGSFNDPQQLVGRVVENRTIKGQPILAAILAPEGAAAGLQALVPKGMRAITIEVNEFSGVAGLLTPGCRVDVIATLQAEGGNVARTIVQNVKVTAVGQRVVLPPPPKDGEPAAGQPQEIVRAITVLAKLKEAEAIELACSSGRPRLVLRSSRDEDVTTSAGITIGELRGPESTGFWNAAAKFLASLPKSTTQPSNTAFASKPTTKPSDDLAKRVVKVYRAGAESAVTLDADRPDTAEASTGSEMIKNAH